MAATRLAHDNAGEIEKEYWAWRQVVEQSRAFQTANAKDAETMLKGPNALYRWSVDSGNRGRTASMLGQAEAVPGVAVPLRMLDPDALRVNVANGTLVFAVGDYVDEDGVRKIADVTVDVEPHDPKHKMTRLGGADWLPGGQDWADMAPEWAAHLAKVLPDEAVRDYFQKALGYSLTGLTVEQCMFMLQGQGGDGKSLTMDVCAAAMGDYAIASDVRTWLHTGNKGGDGPSEDRARLAGASRLVMTAEPPKGSRINDEFIKRYTGGGTVVARGLNMPTFEFVPSGKLFMEVNAKPRVPGDDKGIWRRIKLVPFPVSIPKEERDLGLKSRLVANELEGVLAWLVEGAQNYLREGLIEPPAIAEAIEAYQRSANPFGEWMIESCVMEAGVKTTAAELKGHFDAWAIDQGYEPMTATAFGRSLGDRQLLKKKGAGGRNEWHGVRLADDARTLEEMKPDSGGFMDEGR
jgi:putative DNA primase/helicase